MDANNINQTTEKASVFTIKNILRVLSLLCIVFVFCPSFLVSCSGETINVNVMTAVKGVSSYGSNIVDPHPIMLLCLAIPVAFLVLLFIKKLTDNKTALIILLCGIVDFIIWLIFRSSVKKLAEENYCTFETTAWYFINIIVLILIILLSALVLIMKSQLDVDLIALFSGGGTKEVLGQMSATMNQMSNTVSQMAGSVATSINNRKQRENAIGFCSKCGSPIAYGVKFCTSCGTPVPESMLAEAEAAKKAAEEAARKEAEERARIAAEEAVRKEAERQVAQAAQSNNGGHKFCSKCGAKLSIDAAFCESCGAKVE